MGDAAPLHQHFPTLQRVPTGSRLPSQPLHISVPAVLRTPPFGWGSGGEGAHKRSIHPKATLGIATTLKTLPPKSPTPTVDATLQLPGPVLSGWRLAQLHTQSTRGCTSGGSAEPKGELCWKNRALHHRAGSAAQLLISSNASLARKKECCDLMLIFYTATLIPRDRRAPRVGGGGQADKWVGSRGGKELLANSTRPKLAAL